MDENTQNDTIKVRDEETGKEFTIQNPIFYEPAIPKQDIGYEEKSIVTVDGQDNTAIFAFPDKPQSRHELEMWEIIDEFENKVWSKSNTGIKTGYDSIDEKFDGGLYPGFIAIAGDSNLGKTALMTNLAYGIITNNDDVYVMDFSLDDAMPDKIGRLVACSSKIVMNAVSKPRKYLNYPIMLARRRQALISLRNLSDKYIAYDSSFSTFVEDIQDTIIKKKIYFDENNIDKRIVVFIDNFHDMDIRESPNLSQKEKFDSLAQWCQDFSAKYNITIICSVELKKLYGPKRPNIDDMRESVKIKYAAKATLLVYNEVHYKGESANIYFNIANNPFKQPIFEVHFAKNKYCEKKGRVFFEFYPSMAYLKECDPQAQKAYANIVYG